MPRKLLSLLLMAVICAACTKAGPVDYFTSYPPFELRTEGIRQQAVWGPYEKYVHYTIYYQGQPLAFRYVGPTPHPQFSWFQRVPAGLLLGLRPTDSTQNIYSYHLFLLDAPRGHPRMQGLGRCAFQDPLLYTVTPRLWFTTDSLGMLIGASDSSSILQGPPYRFVDLQDAHHYTPLPKDPVRADGLPLALYNTAWSPDHQLLARTYRPHLTSQRVLLEVFDRRTGRRRLSRLFLATDTAHHTLSNASARHPQRGVRRKTRLKRP